MRLVQTKILYWLALGSQCVVDCELHRGHIFAGVCSLANEISLGYQL